MANVHQRDAMGGMDGGGMAMTGMTKTGMSMPTQMPSHHGMGMGSMGMGGMGMGGMNMGMMSMSEMMMTFYTSTATPLYSTAWTPQSEGQYAGTCIFLIFLSLVLRGLFAYKSVLESRWLHQARQRRYIRVAPGNDAADSDSSNTGQQKESTTAVLTTNGVSESVKLIEREGLILGSTWTRPWRLSVDLPRAVLFTIILGVGYLLMLAVMTMNVGYFMSVLAGGFLGELLVGRYAQESQMH